MKQKGKPSSAILAKAKAKLKEINPTRAKLRQGLADVHLTKKQAQYVLGELANKLQSKTNAVAMGKTSIEHIFPQHAKKANWSDYEALSSLVWHIGNLTLLETKINKEVGNKPFADKVRRYSESEIELTKTTISKYPEWNSENVRKRSVSLVKVIDQIWHIQ